MNRLGHQIVRSQPVGRSSDRQSLTGGSALDNDSSSVVGNAQAANIYNNLNLKESTHVAYDHEGL
jgi:hypothetical protein